MWIRNFVRIDCHGLGFGGYSLVWSYLRCDIANIYIFAKLF